MFARIADMKQVITAKLKLHTTSEQFQALRTTQLAYRDALNHVSQYAYAHGKSSNRVFLQDGTYDLVRTRFKLPSQMACSVPRQVGATYKTLWTKVKQNAAQRKAGMRQDWLRTGTLSVCPDVSSEEIKAARLKRYAELRWSLDTSPSHFMGRGN